MSKKFKAGCDEVFDGTDSYAVTYNSSDEMGEDGVYYTLSNYENGTEESHIKQYVNNISEINEICPMVKTRTNSPDINLTTPSKIPVGVQYGLRLNNSSYPFNIIDSLEVELPDAVFDLFDYFITGGSLYVGLTTMKNTDGVLQDLLRVTMSPVVIEGHNVYKTRLVIAEGCQNTKFTVDKNSPSGNIFYHRGELTACVSADIRVNVLSKLTSKILHTLNETVTNYPHKPTLEKIIRKGRVYLKVTNNTQCHGNIYFDGSPTPCYEYSIPVGNSIEFELPSGAGAYTANVISQTDVVGTGVYRYAYGELSDVLIIEEENLTAILSFNEYTGIISCIVDDINKVTAFILEKYDGSMWSTVGTNSSGEFKISESGTYRITISTSTYFKFTVSPTSITVKTTLDTPTAYSDPAFPSQLGFDEVENANIYDVYRVSEDGEDELVATISQNNIVSRVMRKEKMFIVIPNDEVKK